MASYMLPVIKPSLKPKGVKITAPVHTLLQPYLLIPREAVELHCNVFTFFFTFAVKFNSFLCTFSICKFLPSHQNNVKEPLQHGRRVEVILWLRVDGEREVSLPFRAEHCTSRLIRAQPFFSTSLHWAK